MTSSSSLAQGGWGLGDDFVSVKKSVSVSWCSLMLLDATWCYMMLQKYIWCFWCYLVLLLLHSLENNLKQFGLEGCLLLQSRSKVYIFVVMSNRIQFSSQNCTFQDSKTNAFGCCPGRLCDKGCQRPAFAAYATCCTYCQGPEGPHVSHPWFADQIGFRVDSFFCLERFERVFRLPLLNGWSRPKPTAKTKARDCAQKVELVGYRRTNEPTPAFSSQIVVRAICAELYRSFDKFLEQRALSFGLTFWQQTLWILVLWLQRIGFRWLQIFVDFHRFGRMDPFALVDWCYEDGRTVSIGRTKTAARQQLHYELWPFFCLPNKTLIQLHQTEVSMVSTSSNLCCFLIVSLPLVSFCSFTFSFEVFTGFWVFGLEIFDPVSAYQAYESSLGTQLQNDALFWEWQWWQDPLPGPSALLLPWFRKEGHKVREGKQ